jgi:acyl dehydratase
MKFFEDITVGDRSDLGSHTFTAEEIKRFATKFDPQPFHVDEAAAARSHFGKLAASGWHTSAMCMRHVVGFNRREDAAMRQRGEKVAASGPSPGVRDVRWLKPVYVGDTITFASEIIGKRDTSRSGYGLVVASNTGTNQDGELVYSAQGAVFVERRIK